MNIPTQHPQTELANDTIRAILRTQYEGVGAVRIDSPPGAGKTYIVEMLAAQSLKLLRERCMIATQTNAQALDLTRRLAAGFPGLEITLFCRKGLPLPPALGALPNLNLAHSTQELPAGPCVVVANAAKWSWVGEGVVPFDLQIVDEAFQLPDHRFHQIANLASRLVLIGDPGQIGPVVTCEIDRWCDNPAGPHVPCPEALLHRHPDLKVIHLPVTRRLHPDTVRFVQPAFYPGMGFQALSEPGDRALLVEPSPEADALDDAIDRAAGGDSLLHLTLPERITGENDIELVDAMVDLVHRLLDRKAHVLDGECIEELTPEMIGIACAHVSHVSAIRERLSSELDGVYVETSDRFQGLERHIMLVYHPLSGRGDADAFHLDTGRLCVMLSRHRIACFVFGRDGVLGLLERHVPSGERVLGVETDIEYEGWRAHRTLLSRLYEEGRVVGLAMQP